MTEKKRLELQIKLRRRDRMLMIAIFLTGGRISEVLMLRKRNFTFEDGSKRRDGEPRIMVSGMPLLKRVEVKKELIHETYEVPPPEERQHYQWNRRTDMWRRYKKTYTPLQRERADFPIPFWEPFADELLEYLEGIEAGDDDWLFPTTKTKPTKPGRRLGSNPGVVLWARDVFNIKYRRWISPTRAYQIVRSVGDRLGMHIWDHWFRAERACQLKSNYDFDNDYLEKYLGWKMTTTTPQAGEYGGLSMNNVWRKMLQFKHQLIEELEDLELSTPGAVP